MIFFKSIKPVSFLILIFLIVVLGSLVAAGGYFYMKYKDTQAELTHLKTNTAQVIDQNNRQIVEEIAKFMDLPEGEDPTVATVTNLEQLQGQPFFARAKVGDKVLVYNTAKKAILYDPNAHRIVEVGPLIVAAPTKGASQILENQATPTPVLGVTKFVLYNGTTKIGLTNTYEAELQSKVENAQVIDRDNAKNRPYEKTVLVDLGKIAENASRIAAALGIALVALPEGEVSPLEADYLIIVGEDKL